MQRPSAMERPDTSEYIAWFRANLRRATKHIGIAMVSRYSGITEQAIRWIIDGRSDARMVTWLTLAQSMGLEPTDLFMPPERFAEKFSSWEPVLFFVSPPSSEPSPARGKVEDDAESGEPGEAELVNRTGTARRLWALPNVA